MSKAICVREGFLEMSRESVEVGPVFLEVASEALQRFPNTVGQCISLCAYLSTQLSERNVPHSIVLGSLNCLGVKTFKYTRSFPRRPSGPIEWDGHAWLEFPGDLIGDPSLTRTARVQAQHSNLRLHLDRLGLLQRGGFLLGRRELADSGLKYIAKKELKKFDLNALVRGLEFLNEG